MDQPEKAPELYVEKEVYAQLPADMKKLARADADEGFQNLRLFLGERVPLAEQDGVKREAKEFVEDMKLLIPAALLPADPSDWVFANTDRELLLRYAGDECKLRAGRWQFSFLFRRRFEVEGDRMETLYRGLAQALNLKVGKRKPDDLREFTQYGREICAEFRASAQRGFMEDRFEKVIAFADGKLLLVAISPKVFKPQPKPKRTPKPPMDPKELVEKLKDRMGF